MSMGNRIFLVVFLLIAVLAAMYLIGPSSVGGRSPGERVDLFLEQIGEGYVYDAYQAASSRLREVTFEGFEESVRQYSLPDPSEVSWEETDVQGAEAVRSGEFVRDDGERDHLTFRMVRELGEWRIYTVISERAGRLITESPGDIAVAAGPGGGGDSGVPGGDDLQDLVNESLMRFNEALQIEFFGAFYSEVSEAWQQQTSPAQLQNAFRTFVENDISFASLRGLRATFRPEPYVDEYGILHVGGFYRAGMGRVFFQFKYIQESGEWRLFGMNIDLSREADGAGEELSEP